MLKAISSIYDSFLSRPVVLIGRACCRKKSPQSAVGWTDTRSQDKITSSHYRARALPGGPCFVFTELPEFNLRQMRPQTETVHWYINIIVVESSDFMPTPPPPLQSTLPTLTHVVLQNIITLVQVLFL